MYVDYDSLTEAARLAMTDDKLLAMMVEWNETNDWAQQDMILCKIMNYVKEYKEANPNVVIIEDSVIDDNSGEDEEQVG
jgi:pyridoxal/pyridoxine/pyridoxamine kinase